MVTVVGHFFFLNIFLGTREEPLAECGELFARRSDGQQLNNYLHGSIELHRTKIMYFFLLLIWPNGYVFI